MITERQRYEYNPPDTSLNILYIDDDILVADKPSGLLSVPGKQSDDSLTLRLRELYPDVNPVHRLDTATSGVILFSRNKSANAVLSEQFRNRIPQKRYVARCEGIIREEWGALAYPMSRDWSKSALTSAPIHKVDYAEGKKALTFFRVICRDFRHNKTVVMLEPHTGRTHQLRLHLQTFGYPICNDRLYGLATDECKDRLELHSCYLSFFHPVDKRQIVIYSPAEFISESECDLRLYLPETRYKTDKNS